MRTSQRRSGKTIGVHQCSHLWVDSLSGRIRHLAGEPSKRVITVIRGYIWSNCWKMQREEKQGDSKLAHVPEDKQADVIALIRECAHLCSDKP